MIDHGADLERRGNSAALRRDGVWSTQTRKSPVAPVLPPLNGDDTSDNTSAQPTVGCVEAGSGAARGPFAFAGLLATVWLGLR